MKKIISLIALIAIVTSMFTGCMFFKGNSEGKGTGENLRSSLTEYPNDDFKVYLPKGFKDINNKDFTYAIANNDILFTALEEPIADLAALSITKDTTVEQYASVIISVNNATASNRVGVQTPVKIDGKDIWYFTYSATADGTTYFYTSFTYRNGDSFWLMNFACVEKDKNKYADKFIDYAGLLEFNK